LFCPSHIRPSSVKSRESIRREMRRRRRTLNQQQRRQAAERLRGVLCTSPLFLHSRRIACYLASEGEMDLTPVMERLWSMGKTCYLPVIRRLGHNRLDFAPYRKGDPLFRNCYGIPEPEDRRHAAPPWGLDLLLLPLVAFDTRGNRIGMGGGYYDRTLAYLRRRKYWRTPTLLGVAYRFQQVEEIAAQRWDIPLDGVACETELMLFGSRIS